MPKIIQKIAAKAVIEKDNRILILREAESNPDGVNVGKYYMPGGRLSPGEDFEAGLKREVVEETGLDIITGRPIFVGQWFPIINNLHHQIIGVFVICKSNTFDIKLSEEHDLFAWIDPRQYTNYAITPPEDKVIEEYIKIKGICDI